MRAARPTIKVLFMSGYADDVILQHRVLASDAEFIQKPLTADPLTRKVRRVLDAEPPAKRPGTPRRTSEPRRSTDP